jgi:hypothetical protein
MMKRCEIRQRIVFWILIHMVDYQPSRASLLRTDWFVAKPTRPRWYRERREKHATCATAKLLPRSCNARMLIAHLE